MTKNVLLLCLIQFLFFISVDYAVSQNKISDISISNSGDDTITYVVMYKGKTGLTNTKKVFSNKKNIESISPFKISPIDIIKVKAQNMIEFEKDISKRNDILYQTKRRHLFI